jgi:hypothetical protein
MSIRNNLRATTNPAVTDDSSRGYSQGSRWLNTATGQDWIAQDVTAGAAVWWRGTRTKPWQSQRYMWPDHVVGLSTSQPAAGKLIFQPFHVDRRVTLDRLGVPLVTSQTGGAVRIGIYSSDPDSMLPLALVGSVGEVSMATGSSVVAQGQFTTGGGLLTVAPGLYWLAATFKSGGVMPTVRTASAGLISRSTDNQDINAGFVLPHIEASFSYAGLPATPPTLQSFGAIGNAVLIGARGA